MELSKLEFNPPAEKSDSIFTSLGIPEEANDQLFDFMTKLVDKLTTHMDSDDCQSDSILKTKQFLLDNPISVDALTLVLYRMNDSGMTLKGEQLGTKKILLVALKMLAASDPKAALKLAAIYSAMVNGDAEVKIVSASGIDDLLAGGIPKKCQTCEKHDCPVKVAGQIEKPN